MVVAAFLVVNKANWVRFFEKTFLVANVSPEIVLGMPFLTLSDANVDFSGQELWSRTYIIEEVLLTTRCVKLVGKKEFTATSLDPKHGTDVVHVASLSSTPLASLGFTLLDVNLFWRPQISGLIAKEAPTKVPAEYLNFADVFSSDFVSKLFKYIGINNWP